MESVNVQDSIVVLLLYLQVFGMQERFGALCVCVWCKSQSFFSFEETNTYELTYVPAAR
jgi:hypothetical protein